MDACTPFGDKWARLETDRQVIDSESRSTSAVGLKSLPMESCFTKHFPFELDHELGRRGMEREAQGI